MIARCGFYARKILRDIFSYFLSRISFVTHENGVTFDPNGFIIFVASIPFSPYARTLHTCPFETSVYLLHGERAFSAYATAPLHPYAICKVAVTLSVMGRNGIS